jgi:hypothetical protein
MRPLLPMLATAAAPSDSAAYLFEIKGDSACPGCGIRTWPDVVRSEKSNPLVNRGPC